MDLILFFAACLVAPFLPYLLAVLVGSKARLRQCGDAESNFIRGFR